ncbi:D-lactate dehydrogenase [Salinivibrio sp. IB868]|uniref:D-lactate dehydrogenase n=1 Tax=unclassified Salinivibrio TaxID=2636825 RepID=UPI000984E39B|nr:MULTISPECIES: D-lactate dehydrogenase [unclassified Salinivibrio]OOE69524.1 D-lactate dehydrogenase [Salinivibrio sp. IB868]OOE71320.1 D-lactate dehydrogenase [Salinivibrio sp. IB870]
MNTPSRLSSSQQQAFISTLTDIVGENNVLTETSQTQHYRTGFRSGGGPALAVIFPTSLVMQWRVLQACVDADVVMIMQAANTGLTEGSTPKGSDYDRDVVIINTTRLDGLQLLDNGKQVLSFPGTTLHQLEQTLRPLKRAPHSVIGSSCIGASIVGGVANNSGGALVKRGPAYTEYSLFAQLNQHGELTLVNHLGIALGDDPEAILSRVEHGDYTADDITYDERKASADDYEQILRDVDADSPARYNADKHRLHEVSGCAGKLAVFAVRLDTYPIPEREQVFYIGTNNPDVFNTLRRRVLSELSHLPEVAEYMHRDAFDIAERYGKDVFLAIGRLGTDAIPKMFALKAKITAWLDSVPLLPKALPDKVMQYASQLFPQHLPKRMLAFRDRFEHHLIFKASDEGIEEASAFLSRFFTEHADSDYFACSEDEAKKAMLHRFAAAGAAIRYHTMHSRDVEDILALDIALKRNETEWEEHLPIEIEQEMVAKLYYGHFFCHVFHQDYVVRKGADVSAIKAKMLALLNERGAKYPAEHNVGHLYAAEPDLANFYHQLDPTNSFNPGIGKTGKQKYSADCQCLDHQLRQQTGASSSSVTQAHS